MALVPIDWNPDRAKLATFAEAGMFLLGMVAAPLAYFRGQPTPAAVFWTLGVALRLVGLIRPPWLRPVYVGLALATWPIGWVVSHLAIGLLYYGVVTPIGLAFRLVKRDPLNRRFDRGAATYWVPRVAGRPAESYFRQS